MTSQLKLSKRLEMIAKNIKSQTTFADIGSDHAYLPCRVCLADPTVRAIAGEVQKGPYNNAVYTVEKHRLNKQISVRFGYGFQVIDPDDEIDTIVIAGMGGHLMTDILTEGETKLNNVETLIVQPNTNVDVVRRYLHEVGYSLHNEIMLQENGIIYEILIAKTKATSPYAIEVDKKEKQFFFGPILLQDKTPLFMQKWKHQYQSLQHIRLQMKQSKQIDSIRLDEIAKQMRWIKEDVLK